MAGVAVAVAVRRDARRIECVVLRAAGGAERRAVDARLAAAGLVTSPACRALAAGAS